jgi:UDP-glucose 4-epimerase
MDGQRRRYQSGRRQACSRRALIRLAVQRVVLDTGEVGEFESRPRVKVLVTGGAGYIGASVASACLDAGHTPIILDDLSAGVHAFTSGRQFFAGDVADGAVLAEVFAAHPDIAAVVHCAAQAVVPESVAHPLEYYHSNVAKTVELVEQVARHGCRRVLVSSSAAVYGPAAGPAVSESSPLAPASPYARSKVMVEQVLADAAAAGVLRAIALRYFNPIGADPKLRTGQQAREPGAVLGRLLAAQRGAGPFIIAGTDWPTRDGTGLRDYVHVWDVARAHVRALERFDDVPSRNGFVAVNIGTGAGTTVRELIRAFEAVTGEPLPVCEGPRRPGDVAGAYARVDRADRLLHWHAQLSVSDGIRDTLSWRRVRDAVLNGARRGGAGAAKGA